MSETDTTQTDAQASTDGAAGNGASAAGTPADGTATETDPGGSDRYPVTVRPTIAPTLIYLGLVVVLGGAATAYVVTNPDLVGGSEEANVVGNVLLALTVIGVLRYLLRVYVLRRTEYVVDERSLVRRYELLLRTWRREVPLTMVRSHQLRQGRIEKLLGYGTISVNNGLGDLSFVNVPDPQDVNEMVAEQVSQAAGRGHGSSS